MKESYVVPEMDIAAIESVDVIMASNDGNTLPFEPINEGEGNRLGGMSGDTNDILGF